MTTSNGEPAKRVLGAGYESSPAEIFENEPTTGVYLDTPGSASGYTVSKRGTKRLRISDTKTEVFGEFHADGYVPPAGMTIQFAYGSASAPSITFMGPNHTTGFYIANPEVIGVSAGGTDVMEFGNGLVECKTTEFFTPQTFLKNDGDNFSPQLTFVSEIQTGLYKDSKGLGVSQNGNKIVSLGNPITPYVPINTGTNSITCGSLTSGSISSGTNSISCGSLTSGSISSGTSGITCGSLLSSGSMSSGTNSMTCGVLSASNGVFSSGQPLVQYTDNGVGFNLSNNSITMYGNWAVKYSQGLITTGATTTTIGVTGIYLLTACMIFQQNGTGQRSLFFQDNTGASYGYRTTSPVSSDVTRLTTTDVVLLNSGQTIAVGMYQNSTITLNVGFFSGAIRSEFTVTKLW